LFPIPALEGQSLISIPSNNRVKSGERQILHLWPGSILIQVFCLQHHAVLNSPSASSQAKWHQQTFWVGRRRLVDGTAHAAWQNEVALRRVGQCHAFGVLLRIAAHFVLVALLFLGAFAGEARAHGLHGGLTVQMPANWAEITVSQNEAEAVSEQTGCGVNCCSATGCAAAVLNPAHPGIVVVSIDERFAFPGRAPSKPSLQITLKRPPRA
jgi:hypothetical protein